MRYIEKLIKDKEDSKKTISSIYEDINNLEKYLLSRKFHCGDDLDGYVSISDVLNRLERAKELAYHYCLENN